jgi:2-keto-4-pentenoate hydratase/2-oxohepta-3-ene-1,7-dioic acid hydratase in catechol pathway
MRLVTFRQAGVERLGVEIEDGQLLAVSDLGPGLPSTMSELLAGGRGAVAALQTAVDRPGRPAIDGSEVEIQAPVPRPGKIVAIGLNYRDHAREGGVDLPAAPMVFAKFATSVVPNGAVVEWDPALTSEVDLEAELGVVIGRTARRVSDSDALSYVLGYTCVNDVSARDLQFADKQFVRAKSLDTFCPMGPVLVTADEIPDPQALSIKGILNGTAVQDSSTSEMVFGVAQLVSFCSQAFTLEPGDVIATGTPAGVLVYRTPKVMLKDGDEMTIEIERIGRLTNRCREVSFTARKSVG